MTIVETRFWRLRRFFYSPISEDRHREETARGCGIDRLLHRLFSASGGAVHSPRQHIDISAPVLSAPIAPEDSCSFRVMPTISFGQNSPEHNARTCCERSDQRPQGHRQRAQARRDCGRRAVRPMKAEPQRICPSCGNEFSGAMEFCPVCMLRKALVWLAGRVRRVFCFRGYGQADTGTGGATI
jgi:hypothetical protein